MDIKSLQHVAYRCKDAKETTEFYTRVLGGEHSPYMHIFFRMDDVSYVAFFEIPESPPMGRDENTLQWVQHLARGRRPDRSHDLQVDLLFRPQRASPRAHGGHHQR